MQLPSSPATPRNNAPRMHLEVSDAQAQGKSFIIAQGAYTTHRQPTDDGHIDTKKTTEYSRVEDSPWDKAQFLEIKTVTVDTRSARIIGANELPAFAMDLKNAVNSAAQPGLKMPITPSAATPSDLPDTLPAAVLSSPDHEGNLSVSSSPSTPTALATLPGSAPPGSSGSGNDADNEASSPGSTSSSSSGVICVHPAAYGPITQQDHRRHEWCRQLFRKYQDQLAAAEAAAGSSPAPSLASLANPLSSSPLLPSSVAVTPKTNKLPAPHFSGLQGPLSPLSPLTSSAAPSQASTPSSDADIGTLFTPNTLLVWDDIDGGIEHGFSSPYRGPSTSQLTPSGSGVVQRSVTASGSATRPNKAASQFATPKRPVFVLSDSDSEEADATPTCSSPKKRRV